MISNAQNLFFYLPDKYIDWPSPKIERTTSQTAENQWILKLISDTLIRDVQIKSVGDILCEDNFIDLFPHRQIEVKIICPHKTLLAASDINLLYFNCEP